MVIKFALKKLNRFNPNQKIPSPITKNELMQFNGSLNFSFEFIDKLHVNKWLMFHSLHYIIIFHWNNELETLFQQLKTSITKDVTLTLPDTKYPNFSTVDSCLIDKGCVPFQMNNKAKIHFISYSS